MSITTTTHVNLRGTARAALDHYRDVFGGEVAIVTYGDAGDSSDGAQPTEVMWGQVTSPAGLHLMAYDVPAGRAHDAGVASYFVSVRGTDADEIRGYWDRLAGENSGASIVVPLGPAGWAPLYGMVTDRFGVTWVLDVEAGRG